MVAAKISPFYNQHLALKPTPIHPLHPLPHFLPSLNIHETSLHQLPLNQSSSNGSSTTKDTHQWSSSSWHGESLASRAGSGLGCRRTSGRGALWGRALSRGYCWGCWCDSWRSLAGSRGGNASYGTAATMTASGRLCSDNGAEGEEEQCAELHFEFVI